MKAHIPEFNKDGSERDIKVEIEYFDTWNCDDTLCLIIHPLFKRFKESKHSYAFIEKEDVPKELHNTYDEHGFSKEAFNFVLEEIIWATSPDWGTKEFDLIETEGVNAYNEAWVRRKKAMEMFGKYFFSFWD